MIAVSVQSANGDLFLGSFELPVDTPVIGAALCLDAKSAVGPQLPLGAETMRSLQNAEQYGGSDRTNRRNLAEPFPCRVSLALRQQLPPHLLTHRPQRIELLVVKLRSPAHSRFADLPEPLGAMARCIDLLAGSDGTIGTNVSMYTIDAATGVLTSIGKVAAGLSPSSIAVHPTGKFVYVANYDSNDISMYSVNATTGNLTSIGTLAASAGSITIHPSGKFAYVTTALSVSLYTIDTTTGALLTFAGTTGAGSSPSSLAIHPSGKFAYGTLTDLNSVSMYSIDATTGALTLLGTIGT